MILIFLRNQKLRWGRYVFIVFESECLRSGFWITSPWSNSNNVLSWTWNGALWLAEAIHSFYNWAMGGLAPSNFKPKLRSYHNTASTFRLENYSARDKQNFRLENVSVSKIISHSKPFCSLSWIIMRLKRKIKERV